MNSDIESVLLVVNLKKFVDSLYVLVLSSESRSKDSADEYSVFIDEGDQLSRIGDVLSFRWDIEPHQFASSLLKEGTHSSTSISLPPRGISQPSPSIFALTTT